MRVIPLATRAFMTGYYVVVLAGAALVDAGFLVSHLVERSRGRRVVTVPEDPTLGRMRPAYCEDELKAA